MPYKDPEKRKQAAKAATLRWRLRNIERCKQIQHEWYLRNREYYREYAKNNKEKRIAAVKKWQEKNPEAVKKYKATGYQRNKSARAAANAKWWREHPGTRKAAMDKFRQNNPDRMREFKRRWAKSNPDKIAAKQARRRATLLRATPQWVDMDKIGEVYAEAARMTLDTGIQHDVDHIVPLQGRRVCGLHVENNLQVLPHIDNVKKRNRHDSDLKDAA